MFIHYPEGVYFHPKAKARREEQANALQNALREEKLNHGEKIHHAVVKALANRYRCSYALGKLFARKLGLKVI